MNTAIVGVHTKTKRAEIIATDTLENRAECARKKLIVVSTTIEKAREVWGEIIDDMDALLVPNADLCEFDDLAKRAMDGHQKLVDALVLPAIMAGMVAQAAAQMKLGKPRRQVCDDLAKSILGLAESFPLSTTLIEETAAMVEKHNANVTGNEGVGVE